MSCANGCGASTRRAAMPHHLDAACPLARVACPHEGCPMRAPPTDEVVAATAADAVSLVRSELDAHVRDCEWRRARCAHCGTSLAFHELEVH